MMVSVFESRTIEGANVDTGYVGFIHVPRILAHKLTIPTMISYLHQRAAGRTEESRSESPR